MAGELDSPKKPRKGFSSSRFRVNATRILEKTDQTDLRFNKLQDVNERLESINEQVHDRWEKVDNLDNTRIRNQKGRLRQIESVVVGRGEQFISHYRDGEFLFDGSNTENDSFIKRAKDAYSEPKIWNSHQQQLAKAIKVAKTYYPENRIEEEIESMRREDEVSLHQLHLVPYREKEMFLQNVIASSSHVSKTRECAEHASAEVLAKSEQFRKQQATMGFDSRVRAQRNLNNLKNEAIHLAQVAEEAFEQARAIREHLMENGLTPDEYKKKMEQRKLLIEQEQKELEQQRKEHEQQTLHGNEANDEEESASLESKSLVGRAWGATVNQGFFASKVSQLEAKQHRIDDTFALDVEINQAREEIQKHVLDLAKKEERDRIALLNGTQPPTSTKKDLRWTIVPSSMAAFLSSRNVRVQETVSAFKPTTLSSSLRPEQLPALCKEWSLKEGKCEFSSKKCPNRHYFACEEEQEFWNRKSLVERSHFEAKVVDAITERENLIVMLHQCLKVAQKKFEERIDGGNVQLDDVSEIIVLLNRMRVASVSAVNAIAAWRNNLEATVATSGDTILDRGSWIVKVLEKGPRLYKGSKAFVTKAKRYCRDEDVNGKHAQNFVVKGRFKTQVEALRFYDNATTKEATRQNVLPSSLPKPKCVVRSCGKHFAVESDVPGVATSRCEICHVSNVGGGMRIKPAYIWNGVNYLAKMIKDLDFLNHSKLLQTFLGYGFPLERNPFLTATRFAPLDLDASDELSKISKRKRGYFKADKFRRKNQSKSNYNKLMTTFGFVTGRHELIQFPKDSDESLIPEGAFGKQNITPSNDMKVIGKVAKLNTSFGLPTANLINHHNNCVEWFGHFTHGQVIRIGRSRTTRPNMLTDNSAVTKLSITHFDKVLDALTIDQVEEAEKVLASEERVIALMYAGELERKQLSIREKVKQAEIDAGFLDSEDDQTKKEDWENDMLQSSSSSDDSETESSSEDETEGNSSDEQSEIETKDPETQTDQKSESMNVTQDTASTQVTTKESANQIEISTTSEVAITIHKQDNGETNSEKNIQQPKILNASSKKQTKHKKETSLAGWQVSMQKLRKRMKKKACHEPASETTYLRQRLATVYYWDGGEYLAVRQPRFVELDKNPNVWCDPTKGTRWNSMVTRGKHTKRIAFQRKLMEKALARKQARLRLIAKIERSISRAYRCNNEKILKLIDRATRLAGKELLTMRDRAYEFLNQQAKFRRAAKVIQKFGRMWNQKRQYRAKLLMYSKAAISKQNFLHECAREARLKVRSEWFPKATGRAVIKLRTPAMKFAAKVGSEQATVSIHLLPSKFTDHNELTSTNSGNGKPSDVASNTCTDHLCISCAIESKTRLRKVPGEAFLTARYSVCCGSETDLQKQQLIQLNVPKETTNQRLCYCQTKPITGQVPERYLLRVYYPLTCKEHHLIVSEEDVLNQVERWIQIKPNEVADDVRVIVQGNPQEATKWSSMLEPSLLQVLDSSSTIHSETQKELSSLFHKDSFSHCALPYPRHLSLMGFHKVLGEKLRGIQLRIGAIDSNLAEMEPATQEIRIETSWRRGVLQSAIKLYRRAHQLYLATQVHLEAMTFVATRALAYSKNQIAMMKTLNFTSKEQAWDPLENANDAIYLQRKWQARKAIALAGAERKIALTRLFNAEQEYGIWNSKEEKLERKRESYLKEREFLCKVEQVLESVVAEAERRRDSVLLFFVNNTLTLQRRDTVPLTAKLALRNPKAEIQLDDMLKALTVASVDQAQDTFRIHKEQFGFLQCCNLLFAHGRQLQCSTVEQTWSKQTSEKLPYLLVSVFEESKYNDQNMCGLRVGPIIPAFSIVSNQLKEAIHGPNAIAFEVSNKYCGHAGMWSWDNSMIPQKLRKNNWQSCMEHVLMSRATGSEPLDMSQVWNTNLNRISKVCNQPPFLGVLFLRIYNPKSSTEQLFVVEALDLVELLLCKQPCVPGEPQPHFFDWPVAEYNSCRTFASKRKVIERVRAATVQRLAELIHRDETWGTQLKVGQLQYFRQRRRLLPRMLSTTWWQDVVMGKTSMKGVEVYKEGRKIGGCYFIISVYENSGLLTLIYSCRGRHYPGIGEWNGHTGAMRLTEANVRRLLGKNSNPKWLMYWEQSNKCIRFRPEMIRMVLNSVSLFSNSKPVAEQDESNPTVANDECVKATPMRFSKMDQVAMPPLTMSDSLILQYEPSESTLKYMLREEVRLVSGRVAHIRVFVSNHHNIVVEMQTRGNPKLILTNPWKGLSENENHEKPMKLSMELTRSQLLSLSNEWNPNHLDPLSTPSLEVFAKQLCNVVAIRMVPKPIPLIYQHPLMVRFCKMLKYQVPRDAVALEMSKKRDDAGKLSVPPSLAQLVLDGQSHLQMPSWFFQGQRSAEHTPMLVLSNQYPEEHWRLIFRGPLRLGSREVSNGQGEARVVEILDFRLPGSMHDLPPSLHGLPQVSKRDIKVRFRKLNDCEMQLEREQQELGYMRSADLASSLMMFHNRFEATERMTRRIESVKIQTQLQSIEQEIRLGDILRNNIRQRQEHEINELGNRLLKLIVVHQVKDEQNRLLQLRIEVPAAKVTTKQLSEEPCLDTCTLFDRKVRNIEQAQTMYRNTTKFGTLASTWKGSKRFLIENNSPNVAAAVLHSRNASKLEWEVVHSRVTIPGVCGSMAGIVTIHRSTSVPTTARVTVYVPLLGSTASALVDCAEYVKYTLEKLGWVPWIKFQTCPPTERKELMVRRSTTKRLHKLQMIVQELSATAISRAISNTVASNVAKQTAQESSTASYKHWNYLVNDELIVSRIKHCENQREVQIPIEDDQLLKVCQDSQCEGKQDEWNRAPKKRVNRFVWRAERIKWVKLGQQCCKEDELPTKELVGKISNTTAMFKYGKGPLEGGCTPEVDTFAENLCKNGFTISGLNLDILAARGWINSHLTGEVFDDTLLSYLCWDGTPVCRVPSLEPDVVDKLVSFLLPRLSISQSLKSGEPDLIQSSTQSNSVKSKEPDLIQSRCPDSMRLSAASQSDVMLSPHVEEDTHVKFNWQLYKRWVRVKSDHLKLGRVRVKCKVEPRSSTVVFVIEFPILGYCTEQRFGFSDLQQVISNRLSNTWNFWCELTSKYHPQLQSSMELAMQKIGPKLHSKPELACAILLAQTLDCLGDSFKFVDLVPAHFAMKQPQLEVCNLGNKTDSEHRKLRKHIWHARIKAYEASRKKQTATTTTTSNLKKGNASNSKRLRSVSRIDEWAFMHSEDEYGATYRGFLTANTEEFELLHRLYTENAKDLLDETSADGYFTLKLLHKILYDFGIPLSVVQVRTLFDSICLGEPFSYGRFMLWWFSGDPGATDDVSNVPRTGRQLVMEMKTATAMHQVQKVHLKFVIQEGIRQMKERSKRAKWLAGAFVGDLARRRAEALARRSTKVEELDSIEASQPTSKAPSTLRNIISKLTRSKPRQEKNGIKQQQSDSPKRRMTKALSRTSSVLHEYNPVDKDRLRTVLAQKATKARLAILEAKEGRGKVPVGTVSAARQAIIEEGIKKREAEREQKTQRALQARVDAIKKMTENAHTKRAVKRAITKKVQDDQLIAMKKRAERKNQDNAELFAMRMATSKAVEAHNREDAFKEEWILEHGTEEEKQTVRSAIALRNDREAKQKLEARWKRLDDAEGRMDKLLLDTSMQRTGMKHEKEHNTDGQVESSKRHSRSKRRLIHRIATAGADEGDDSETNKTTEVA